MPTYPKGPSLAPAPMLDGDMGDAIDEGDEDYLRPSEFGNGGYYDGGEKSQPLEPIIRAERRNPNTMSTPGRKITRTVASPGTSFRSGVTTKVRREPVAPPRDFDEMEYLPEPRDIRTNAKEWSREDLSVSNDTNYSDVFHMMKSGSQQNRQVSHWATSFREATPTKPVRRERRPSVGSVGRPGWNANLGKKTGWKSLEQLHATTSAVSSVTTLGNVKRTPRYSNARSSSVSRMQQQQQQPQQPSGSSFIKEYGPPSFLINDERDHYQQPISTSHNPPAAVKAAAPPSFSSYSSSNNSFSSIPSGFQGGPQQPGQSQSCLRNQLTNTLSRLRASLHD